MKQIYSFRRIEFFLYLCSRKAVLRSAAGGDTRGKSGPRRTPHLRKYKLLVTVGYGRRE